MKCTCYGGWDGLGATGKHSAYCIINTPVIFPCLYCNAATSLANPSVACNNPECRDKEDAAYESMD